MKFIVLHSNQIREWDNNQRSNLMSSEGAVSSLTPNTYDQLER